MQRLCVLSIALATSAASIAHAQSDSDLDGIPDSADAFPCDPLRAAVSFVPAEQAHGMLLFEDQWPYASDLDFNDVALAYNLEVTRDAAGRAWSINATINVLALGGDYDNGLGWHVPVHSSLVQSVSLRRGVGLPPETLALSPNDGELTFIISSNLREFFGGIAGTINSDDTRPLLAPATLEVEIAFASPVVLPDSSAPWDLYIFRSADPAHEIHGPAYGGTSMMRSSLFGIGIDASTPLRRFVDSDGLPFRLELPAVRSWPREGLSVDQLWPSIIQFAASAGATHADFYESTVNLPYAFGGASFQPAPGFLSDHASPRGDVSCLPSAWRGRVVFSAPGGETVRDAVIDDQLRTYVAGTTSGQLLSSMTRPGAFLAAFSPTGTLLWAHVFPWVGLTHGHANAVAIDGQGLIYVEVQNRDPVSFQGYQLTTSDVLIFNSSGLFLGGFAPGGRVSALKGDPVSGVWVLGNGTDNNPSDAIFDGSFVARYSNAGVEQLRHAGVPGTMSHLATQANFTARDFVLAADGEVIIWATVGNNGPYQPLPQTALLTRLDPATGTVRWTQTWNRYRYVSSSDQYRVEPERNSLADDGEGGAYMSLTGSGYFTFGSGLNVIAPTSSYSALGRLVRVGPSGIRWAVSTTANTSGHSMGRDPAVSPDLFLCGSTGGDTFVARVTPTGQFVFASSMPASSWGDTLRMCAVKPGVLRVAGQVNYPSDILLSAHSLATGYVTGP